MQTASFLRFAFLAASFVSTIVAVNAQEVRIGGLEGTGTITSEMVLPQSLRTRVDGIGIGGLSAAEIVDWSRTATASGKVTTATVAWTAGPTPCAGVFYVRFYVINDAPFTITEVAERGPFQATAGMNTVALDPPVSVAPGTYIGVFNASTFTCGGGQPYGTRSRNPGKAVLSVFQSQAAPYFADNFHLQAQASNVPSVRVATIPAVAATPGSLGSFFRTSLTLANQRSTEIRGKLVFRAAGHSGSDSDPSVDFVVPAGGTINYDDLLATMGQSGLGSLDILTTGSATPLAAARVFNDAGATGTNGFSEDAVPGEESWNSEADILIPTDLTNFRLNIGIRSFHVGSMNVVVYDASGHAQATMIRAYTADYFEQVPVADFLGFAAPAGGRIVLSNRDQLNFIAYGAVTDNRTNDPSMRIGSD